MILVQRISYTVGEFHLSTVSLQVSRGEYFVLMGPPGSGKSVFLECLCGLRRIQSGRIFLDDRDLTGIEPGQRGIGYVPQDYALFPHLSVEQNISFGLQSHRGTTRGQVRERARHMAEMLGIGYLLSRRIPSLSGGERQRVALARALAIQPRVLLLDEPVSALDESTRDSICRELRRIQRELKLTVIHVCHSLEEAFLVGDRGGILHQGTFQQTGALSELLRRPRNEVVARLMRSENLLTGDALGPVGEPPSTLVRVGDSEWPVPGRHKGRVTFVIRPENLQLARGTCEQKGFVLPVRLARVIDRGAYVRAELTGAVFLIAHVPGAAFASLGVVEGSELSAVISPSDIYVLPADCPT